MKIETIEQLKDIANCDSSLFGISWPSSENSKIIITLETPSKGIVDISYIWVSELIINLDLKKHFMGLTWDIDYKKNETRWTIEMDFGTDGLISFECGDIFIEQSK